MNSQRRQVLKGMVLTGSALGSLGSSATAWANRVQQAPPCMSFLRRANARRHFSAA